MVTVSSMGIVCEFLGTDVCSRCGQWAPDPQVVRNCSGNQQAESALVGGPGTELKRLLAGWPFGFVAGPDCKCNRRARYMDEMGCQWVEQNIEECVGYLRESAADRGLPFLDVAARLLIRRAIRNARRASA